MTLKLRPAGLADASSLMGLRTEAERWLQTLGTDQWSDTPTATRALSKWKADIEAGMTWVVVDGHENVVATATRSVPDRDFWLPTDGLESALYISKIIVSRGAAGRNVGGMLLDWASQLAALEARAWVRIDVWRTNHQLHAYYRDRGFQHVRTEAPSHRLSGWLGQRPAGMTEFPDRLIPALPAICDLAQR